MPAERADRGTTARMSEPKSDRRAWAIDWVAAVSAPGVWMSRSSLPTTGINPVRSASAMFVSG
jgi:hypothetical protein